MEPLPDPCVVAPDCVQKIEVPIVKAYIGLHTLAKI